MTVQLLCLVVAAICFAVATLWVPGQPSSPPRFNLVAAGLAFLTLSFIFPSQ